MARRSDGLTQLAKAATPTLLGVLGVLLLAAPIRLFEGYVPTPIFPLLVVFFWALYAPSYLPAASVFGIGLLQDFLSGGPFGLWPAVYLFTLYVAQTQRAYFFRREQFVIVIGFAYAAAAAGLILWLVMSLMSGRLLPVEGLIWQIAVTIVAYWALSPLLRRLHRRALAEA